MTASLLQLVAIGNEDYLLHGNPQISYFKSVNLKYVNFSMERVDTLPITSVKPNINTTSETIFEINVNNIDALGNIYIALTLPEIKSKYPDQFEWIDDISDFIVEKAEFIINSTKIETIDSNIIHMHKKNNTNLSNINLIKDISNPKLTTVTPKYTYNDNNKISRPDNMKSIKKINMGYNKFPSINSQTIYIKLPFFFSRNEITLPVVSLKKSKIFVKLYFRPFKNLFRIKTEAKVTLKTNANLIFDHTNTETYEQYTYDVCETLFTKNNNHKLYDFINKFDNLYDNLTLISYVYFFDKSDTDFFKKKTNILINKYIVYENIVDKPVNQLIIENNDLVKEITIIPQRNDINLRNNYNYYGIHDYNIASLNSKKWFNYYYELCYNQYVADINYINKINEENNSILEKVIDNMSKINVDSYIVFSYYDNKNRHQCKKYVLNNNNLNEMLNYCKSDSDEFHSPFLYYGMFQNTSTFDVISVRPYYFRYKLLNLNYKTVTIKSLAYLPKIYSNNNTIFMYFDQPTYTDSILTENIYVENDSVVTKESTLAILNQWNMRYFKNIPFINDNNYSYFNSDHCIESIDIKYKGNSIINKLNKNNIYKTSIFNHYRDKVNIDNIVKIPFSLYPNKYSPSGHINLQNIDRLLIETKIKDIFNTDELLDDNKIKLDIYLSTINILVINDNKINLAI